MPEDEADRVAQTDAARQKRDMFTDRLFYRLFPSPDGTVYSSEQPQPGTSTSSTQCQQQSTSFDTLVIFVEKQYTHTRAQLVEPHNKNQPLMWHYEVFVRKANFGKLMRHKQGISVPHFDPQILPNFQARNGVGPLTSVLNNMDVRVQRVLIRHDLDLHALVSGITYRLPKVIDVFPIEPNLRAIQFTIQRQVDSSSYLDVPTLYTINLLSLGPMWNKEQRNEQARLSSAKALKQMRQLNIQFKNFFIGFYEANLPVGVDERDFRIRRHKMEPNGIVCSDSFAPKPA